MNGIIPKRYGFFGMGNNLEMTVNNLAKNAKDNENDVASELSPEDIRNNLAQVMKELKREGS